MRRKKEKKYCRVSFVINVDDIKPEKGTGRDWGVDFNLNRLLKRMGITTYSYEYFTLERTEPRTVESVFDKGYHGKAIRGTFGVTKPIKLKSDKQLSGSVKQQ